VKDLKVHYPIRGGFFNKIIDYVYAVDGVSFTIEKGKTYGLVGESGSGKSTIGKAIIGLEKIKSGKIIYEGKEIDEKFRNRRSEYNRNVQMIFQDSLSSLNPKKRVIDIISEPLRNFENLSVEEEKRKVSELLDDPRVKGAALTGSEPAGASFASAAGKNVKKSILELGGSDAFIVMPDADLDKAVETAVNGRLWNAGQVCVSPKRVIVSESLYPAFLEKATQLFGTAKVGDPLDPETQLAPLSSVKAREDVLSQVEKAVAQGAKLVTGGKKIEGPGAFMQPTILTDIKKGMDAYSDEIFGPVLMIYSVKNMDEAVDLANDTKYGLGGTVFGTDVEEAVKIARRIDTGMVYINHVTGISPELPFGGTKNSGYGREQSIEGIYEFVNSKLIRVTTPDAAY